MLISETHGPTPRSRRPVLLLLLALWVVAACGALFVVRWGTSTLERARKELGRRLEASRSERWTRPVLRGQPVDDDALEAQLAAARALPGVRRALWADYARSSITGAPIGGGLGALVAASGPKLDDLRAAAQRGWARRIVDPEDDEVEHAPRELHVGWELLLVRASNAAPAECLEVCADVLRLAHDAAMSGGHLGVELAADAPEMVAPFALRCARDATPAERVHAIGELRALAKDVVPLGRALAFDEVRGAVALDAEIASPRGVFRFLTRKRYIDALDLLITGDRAWEDLRADRYRPSLGLVQSSALQVNANEVLAPRGLFDPSHLERDTRGLATLRALIVAMTGVPDGPGSAAVRDALADPELSDPFSDEALVVEADPDGQWRVVSPGSDGQRTAPIGTREGLLGRDVVVVVASR